MPSAAATPALECRSLSLGWEGRPVVRDVSLAVAAGEVCCLVGRSGCGKTTLFHGLAGLSEPDAGRVLVHGEDVTGRPGRVSDMLQKDLLLPSRTIMGNVCLPMLLAGVPRAEARAKAAPLFARFGLEGCEDSWPSQLSGGMRQRAALLRTYLMDNDVVLLDEPFSALDPTTKKHTYETLRDVHDRFGCTVVFVTHDFNEARNLGHRAGIILDGALQAVCPADELFMREFPPRVMAFLGREDEVAPGDEKD